MHRSAHPIARSHHLHLHITEMENCLMLRFRWAAVQSCDTITTYGIGNGPQPKNQGQVNWHYFENRHFRYSREFGRDPHHSFDLEHDSLEVSHPPTQPTNQLEQKRAVGGLHVVG
jgi:hypothetical protein